MVVGGGWGVVGGGGVVVGGGWVGVGGTLVLDTHHINVGKH